jgi:hypothetical protein
VSEQIAGYMGATKTFIDFILEYLPDEPSKRPIEFGRINWSKSCFKDYLSKIYSYRSKALHGGIPFPAPMCEPPMWLEKGLSEKPMGIAIARQNAVWVADDLPMQLHIFEYIVRNTLLKWWDSLNTQSNSNKESRTLKS